jgi:hypothetical protein
MLKSFKRHWRQFKRYPPGQRFRRLHDRRLESPRGRILCAVYLAGGLTLVAIGLIMLVAPGPGTLVLAAGVAILVQESLLVARVLDWAELRVRRLFVRSKRAAAASEMSRTR